MSNPFQEQFLKAGLVTEKQVKQANQKKKGKPPQRKKKGPKPVDEATKRARAAEQAKAQRDRELNQRKQEQARNKAISIEIDQLIRDNKLARDDNCEIGYQFQHRGKISKLYVNADMKQRIIDGKLGIARIEGRYELVPLATAKKIQERNDKRVVLLNPEDSKPDENDPYADYQVPDDLMW
jgi:uncharacterized protein YaiL (DUF2058 family)